MPAITLNGASPIDASDDVRYAIPTGQGLVTQQVGLGDVPADFLSMDSASFAGSIEYRVVARNNDTVELAYRVMSGALGEIVLVAATSTGTAITVDSNVVSATDVVASPAIAYVNTSATKADWNTAYIELRQTTTKAGPVDDAYIEIDHVQFTGTYTQRPAVPQSAYNQAIYADTPIAYWPQDETSGTTAFDASGNARDAVHTNGPTVNQASLTALNKAVDYDGSDDRTMFASTNTVTGPQSIEMWFKRDVATTTTGETLYSTRTSSGEFGFNFGVQHDTSFGLDYGTGSAWVKNISLSISPLTLGTGWHHVVITADINNVNVLYLDGAEVARHDTTSAATALIWDTVRTPHWGSVSRYPGQYQHNGLIDEVAIYDKALTAAQVLAHYNAGVGAVGATSSLAMML